LISILRLVRALRVISSDIANQEIGMMAIPNFEAGKHEISPGESPTQVSKPIGDAIPAPTEPGMDQPLPEKDVTPSADDVSRNDTAEESEKPSGEAVSKPIGDAIPAPVEPGLNQPLPEKGADAVKDETP
jgi:hypothetical protein